MSLFGTLTNDGLEETQDRIGGYSAKESGIYTGTLKQFYAGESSGGARSVTIILSGGDFGKDEYRETCYVTSGRDKGQKNYFMAKDASGKETGKKSPLPSFTIIDDICLATIGKPLAEMEFEDKIVNIYDPEQKKEMPKSVPVATEILGQEVSLAILKTTENQTEKDSNGNYVPKADGSTRDVNSIDKVFNTATRGTIAEARAATASDQPIEAKFWDAWEAKNKGVTRDRTQSSGAKNGKPGQAPTSGNASGSGSSSRSSLFGNKG